MSDREQFILRQAAKFDDRVRNELGMSANDVLKVFSEGRLKDNNIEQQLAATHRAGWEQCQREAEKIVGTNWGVYGWVIAKVIASMEYKGVEKTV